MGDLQSERQNPLRIGLFIDNLLSPYQIRLFNGACRAARANGARLFGFQGDLLRNEVEGSASFDGSFLYDLACGDAADGLIVVSTILATLVGIDAVRALCAKSSVPVVSVGELPGFPYVGIDTQRGLQRLVEHLVQVHHCRRIAFIRGNEGNPESGEREAVFRTTLAALGIPVSETLILPGNFLETSGRTAIAMLFDERRVRPDYVDAVVAANDQMASGAATELALRGIRVPEQVAVVGFDDDDHARSNSPPLTTVAQPIERLGERAVELLLEHLTHAKAPNRVILEVDPIFRASCGCKVSPRNDVKKAGSGKSFSDALGAFRRDGSETLSRFVGRPTANRGIDALVRVMSRTDGQQVSQGFADFERVLLATAEHGVDPLRWEDAGTNGLVSALPDPGALPENAPPAAAERHRRLLDLRLLTNEVAARTNAMERLRALQQASSLRVLGSTLACSRNLRSVGRVLESALPALGIRYYCVCLFVEGSSRRVARVVAHSETHHKQPAALLHDTSSLWRSLPTSMPPSQLPDARDSLVFSASDLFHPAAMPAPSYGDLLIYPLVFAEQALGYVVFDAPEHAGQAWLRENVAGHLGSALYALAKAEELRRARALAEKASAAKSEFVAIMSHEVRTPLTAVLGHLDLCLSTSLSKEQRMHVERARASSGTLLRIVSDVLDFSKIDAEKLELEAVSFDLEDVLSQVSGTHALAAVRKNIEFVLDVEDDVPRALIGDPLRLTQVLLNLVGNALKFSSSGHVVLEVSLAEPDPKGKSRLAFSVIDTGIGMSKEQLASVFRPFAQANSSMTRRFGGTGLGLAISKRLVELMGGELDVKSAPGEGSVFGFCVPFDVVPRMPSLLPQGRGESILVIEESEPQRRALERALGARGFRVMSAATAAFGLGLLEDARKRQLPVELALVDYGLKDIVNIAARINEGSARAPTALILLHAISAQFLAEGYAEYGAVAAVSKPFTRKSLLAALSAARGESTLAAPELAPQTERNDLLLGRHLLVVQDDEVSLQLQKGMLEACGAKVHVATDGAEAVKAAAEQDFDVILMDLHLPVLDGCEATRAIRDGDDTHKTLIIGLSAASRSEGEARCLAAGMNAYLSVPFDFRQFLRVMNTLLAQPAREQRVNVAALEADSPRVLGPRPDLDVDGALARLNGNLQMYLRLLRRFLSTQQQASQALHRALASADIEAAIMIAHTSVSAAVNIGATRLPHAARALEAALRTRATEPITKLVGEFDVAQSAALSAVSAFLRSATHKRSSHSLPALHAANILQKLKELVERHDTEAVETVELLRQVLGERCAGSGELQRVEASVEAYDFDRAKVEIKALADVLREAEESVESSA